MTADDGEMVMEIVNVRTTSYEAAVPQKDDTALSPAPYGEMVWDLDIDSLDGTNTKGLTAVNLTNLILFKYPSMKVLGMDMTAAKLVLQKNPLSQYTVTINSDVDDERSAKASIEKYSNASVIAFDSSQDLESQSLSASSYDVVVATGDLLHLLIPLVKPGGFLIRVDDSTIQKVPGQEKDKEQVATSSSSSAATNGAYHARIVYRSKPCSNVALLKTELESLGWRADSSNLIACADPSFTASHVIMMDDFDTPVLSSPSESEFLAIQKITSSVSSLLWVTSGGLLKGKRPEHAMASGLARSVTSEQASLDFRTLDFDMETVKQDQVIQSIVRVAQLQFTRNESTPEREFCVAHGKTYISRLVRNAGLNDMFVAQEEPEDINFTPGDRISGKVLHGKVVFEKENVDEVVNNIKAGHVEVQVAFAGLTKEGVMVITGSDYPTTFSHEIGGIVTKVGADVKSLRVGDKGESVFLFQGFLFLFCICFA